MASLFEDSYEIVYIKELKNRVDGAISGLGITGGFKEYIEKTGRRITIEYILIHGYNDTLPVAKELVYYLKDLKCNINLIPYNSVIENDYKKPSGTDIMKFKFILEHSGKKVTVRLERGADIDAACGQLRGKVK